MSSRRGRPARLAGGALSEDAFSAQVSGLAAFYGWRGYHTHDSRRSARGFPDWTFVRIDAPAAELLFVELKPDAGAARVTIAEAEARPEWLRHRDLTNDQAAWLEDLAAVGAGIDDLLRFAAAQRRVPVVTVEAHIWRPRDWPIIERRLAAGRALQPSVNRP